MDFISMFDMLKIGIGPSSSHTLGPWKASLLFRNYLNQISSGQNIVQINIHLFGSLSLTGKGHATDKAVVMGLLNYDPETVPVELIEKILNDLQTSKCISIQTDLHISFEMEKNIVFENYFLPFHPNALKYIATTQSGKVFSETYYSVGGGFVLIESNKNLQNSLSDIKPPYPINKAQDLLNYCLNNQKSVSEIVTANELSIQPLPEISAKIKQIWQVMLQSMFIGCHTYGILPGQLKVKRRAADIHNKLQQNNSYKNSEEWITVIRQSTWTYKQIINWVSCFALAVNEVNAAMGRIVTAPTNGSAGVIPTVLMYYLCFENKTASFLEIERFLMVAAEIGSIFKKGATISAAMGGCQAEIGVSSAMAAAALCELIGGTAEQVLIAAEIAIEHHLGLTCDPIAGLVQVPCIERNTMGASKAIQAAELALNTTPKDVKVPLDKVIESMWEISQNMNVKYKETSQGGLAVAVNIPDC